MAKKKMNLENLEDAISGADMVSNKKATKKTTVTGEKPKKKRKMIEMSEEWDQKIKTVWDGTIAGYIRMAIRNQMERDGIL